MFDYIYPDENTISDVIANMLDPSGTHGQGEKFLRNFLSEIGISINSDKVGVQIKREETTKYIRSALRRIDITIDFNNCERAIAIENKPWDGEQLDQVKDYIDHLSKKYKDNYVLVYLTGDGSEPQSIEQILKVALIAEGRLRVIPYIPRLMNWLEVCFKDCQSEKMRLFLRDFMRYIENNFRRSFEEGD
ncbi:MAG TPA: PD-(D/E)XK nuclease family protein [Thermodesulfobacteriota bacterium]|nr:PD-(D/E)XK nuclease family protein [Thermodesulfobacteriota bacterium]